MYKGTFASSFDLVDKIVFNMNILIISPVFAIIISRLIACAGAGDFYTSASNKVYYVDPAYSFKWFEAHNECHSKNMTLFTIENEDSFYDLYNILISGKFARKPPHLWIGAVGAQRQFTWITNGEPVVWKYSSFDNAGNMENCLQLSENSKNINDRNCVQQLGFVCEENKYSLQCEQAKLASKNVFLNIHQYSHN